MAQTEAQGEFGSPFWPWSFAALSSIQALWGSRFINSSIISLSSLISIVEV